MLAAALTALAAVVAAQEPICNPCVDGPEMLQNRRFLPLSSECPVALQPIVHPTPEFPESGERTLVLIVSFSVQTDGSVLAPSVRSAQWFPAREAEKVPESFEKAIVDAISTWRYPPQSKPCENVMPLGFGHVL